ncbi:hypothetical protein MRX96_050499 [Rhipicephalus microplus]
MKISSRVGADDGSPDWILYYRCIHFGCEAIKGKRSRRDSRTGVLVACRERLTVLAWQDLGRGLLLSENPAPTREVPDCPPPSRRASQGPGLARTSPVWLPATERRFVHSALNPCCCYVVATPDIYPTTITSSQGLNQPTASWSPSTAT